MMTTADPRVVAYLRRLEEAAAGLRPERRAELVAEIRDHIDTRLSDPGPAVSGMDPVDVALARLGEPEEIAAAAAEEPGALNRAAEPAGKKRLSGLEGAAIALLLVGGFVLVVGWIVGVVLLWMSPRWSVRDKLIGTLVWPGGLATPALLSVLAVGSDSTCTTSTDSNGDVSQLCTGGPSLVTTVLAWVFLLAPIAVAVYLGVMAGRADDRVTGPGA